MPHCRGPAWKGRVFGQWLKSYLRSYSDEGCLFSFPEVSGWVIIFRPLWAESVLERSPYPHHKPVGCCLAGQAILMSVARCCRGSGNRHDSLAFICIYVDGFAFDQSSHETREMFILLQVCLYELCGSHKIARAYNVQKHIPFIYLFSCFWSQYNRLPASLGPNQLNFSCFALSSDWFNAPCGQTL